MKKLAKFIFYLPLIFLIFCRIIKKCLSKHYDQSALTEQEYINTYKSRYCLLLKNVVSESHISDNQTAIHPTSCYDKISLLHSIDKNLNFNRNIVISFLFFHRNICWGNHLKRLTETLQMSTHNICFRVEIRKLVNWTPLLSFRKKCQKKTLAQ